MADVTEQHLTVDDAYFTMLDQTSIKLAKIELMVDRLARDGICVRHGQVGATMVDLGMEAVRMLESLRGGRGDKNGLPPLVSSSALPLISVGAFGCEDFFVRLPPSTMKRPESLVPCGEFRGKISGEDIFWDGERISGKMPVDLELRDVVLDYPRSGLHRPALATALLAAGPGGAALPVAAMIDVIPKPPLLRLDRFALQVIPSETVGHLKWVQNLDIVNPKLFINPERLPQFSVNNKRVPVTEASLDSKSVYFGWIPKNVSVVGGGISVSGYDLLLPPLSMGWGISTNRPSGESIQFPKETAQELTVTDLRFHSPVSGSSELVSLATLGEMRLKWNVADLWVKKEFIKLSFKNLHMQVGQSIYDRFSKFPRSVVKAETGVPVLLSRDPLLAPKSPAFMVPAPFPWRKSRLVQRLRQWRIRSVELSQSTVTVTDVLPGIEGSLLPRLTLPVEFSAPDVPITEEGLMESVELRPVILRNLEIMSPYSPQIPVALLPRTTVKFSLNGLFRRRIESVEISDPVLYIGQDLFWYQEYVRKVTGESKVDKTGETGTETAEKGWSLGKISSDSGKMIIALKGVPLKAFQLPFPFQFSYEFLSNAFSFSSDIPERDYEFSKQDIALLGVRGDLRFNLPLPAQSNNLVNTVFIREARWKNFSMTDAWASVTYDAESVTCEFGARAYGGYVTGGFYMKLDKDYSWTAWLSGTDVETKGITQALAPDYFMLDTRVSGKLTAAGTSKELFDTLGHMKITRSGQMRIQRIDDIVEVFPKEWSITKREMTKLALAPLQKYHFEDGSVTFNTKGREGDVTLVLEGKEGKREIVMRLHDYRSKSR